MFQQKFTALVLGANGLVGEEVTNLLLKSDKYEVVYAVSRQGIQAESPKLVQILADMDNAEDKLRDINVDHLFSCIGSTRAKSSDDKEYYKIDHDYPLLVAALLKSNGCRTVCLVSSIGANTGSKNFYLKLKGQVEQSLIAVGIDTTLIFRPSLLMGKRKEYRAGERIMQLISPLLNALMVGPFKKFRSIPAVAVARSMVNIAASFGENGVKIYETEDIRKLV